MSFRSIQQFLFIGLPLFLFGAVALLAGVSPPVSSKAYLDNDGDGLRNADEALRGTSPENPNSDGDSESDLTDAVGYDSNFSHLYVPGPGDANYAIVDMGPVETAIAISPSKEYGLYKITSNPDVYKVKRLIGDFAEGPEIPGENNWGFSIGHLDDQGAVLVSRGVWWRDWYRNQDDGEGEETLTLTRYRFDGTTKTYSPGDVPNIPFMNSGDHGVAFIGPYTDVGDITWGQQWLDMDFVLDASGEPVFRIEIWESLGNPLDFKASLERTKTGDQLTLHYLQQWNVETVTRDVGDQSFEDEYFMYADSDYPYQLQRVSVPGPRVQMFQTRILSERMTTAWIGPSDGSRQKFDYYLRSYGPVQYYLGDELLFEIPDTTETEILWGRWYERTGPYRIGEVLNLERQGDPVQRSGEVPLLANEKLSNPDIAGYRLDEEVKTAQIWLKNGDNYLGKMIYRNKAAYDANEPIQLRAVHGFTKDRWLLYDDQHGTRSLWANGRSIDLHAWANTLRPNTWSNFQINQLLDDGRFLGTAQKNGETHAVMLLKVDLDPVYGEGPDGIGYCPSSIGDAIESCTYVGTDLDDIDVNGAINQILNPAAIVIESSNNDGNVAVFQLEAEGVTDEQAEEIFHWEIESEGGSASFYPSAGDNKGKIVKVSGTGTGRVRLNVRTSSSLETDPVLFTEAVVVNKMTLPYRANILTYEGNDPEILPSAFTDIPKVIHGANIILRQAGIELVQSSDNEIGSTEHAQGQQTNSINNLGNAFYAQAEDLLFVENVGALNAIRALSINYRPNLMQVNFIESFNTAGREGRNLIRPSSTHPGSSLSAAYKTSENDEDDESIVHTLGMFAGNELQDYPDLFGVLIRWGNASDQQRQGGYALAHEALHAMNLLHRQGELGPGDNVDGLETKYLGPKGTNIMDYGGGIDLDLLQALIARGSPLLK